MPTVLLRDPQADRAAIQEAREEHERNTGEWLLIVEAPSGAYLHCADNQTAVLWKLTFG